MHASYVAGRQSGCIDLHLYHSQLAVCAHAGHQDQERSLHLYAPGCGSRRQRQHVVRTDCNFGTVTCRASASGVLCMSSEATLRLVEAFTEICMGHSKRNRSQCCRCTHMQCCPCRTAYGLFALGDFTIWCADQVGLQLEVTCI